MKKTINNSIINLAPFGEWESVNPDYLSWANSKYPYPVYLDPSSIAETFVQPKEDSPTDTCQFCGYLHLTRLWYVRTKDRKLYSIVGSECWKDFNPVYVESKNVVRDVLYMETRKAFMKHRHTLLKEYWVRWNDEQFRTVRNSAFKFSKTLNELTSYTERKDVKKMCKDFTIIYDMIERMPWKSNWVIPDEIKDVLKYSYDKTVRTYWNE